MLFSKLFWTEHLWFALWAFMFPCFTCILTEPFLSEPNGLVDQHTIFCGEKEVGIQKSSAFDVFDIEKTSQVQQFLQRHAAEFRHISSAGCPLRWTKFQCRFGALKWLGFDHFLCSMFKAYSKHGKTWEKTELDIF